MLGSSTWNLEEKHPPSIVLLLTEIYRQECTPDNFFESRLEILRQDVNTPPVNGLRVQTRLYLRIKSSVNL